MTANKKTGMSALRSELLDDIVTHVSTILEDNGIAEDLAEQSAIAAADFLAEHWGGQLICFPKNFLFKLAQRDLLIYDEFNGRNHAQLAKKWHMSVRGIYKLVNRVQKRVVAEIQPDLFAEE